MTIASRSALFVAIPAIGHLNPLLLQALELQRRGWRVAVASTAEMRGYVEDNYAEVTFVSLGADASGGVGKPEVQARAAAASSFRGGTLEIMRQVNAVWPVMFDGLCAEVQRQRPDILVVDLVTSAGMDVAEQERIPYVVNNADLLTAISVRLLPPAPSVPLLFSGKSIHHINRVDRWLNPLLRWLGATVVDVTLGRDLNRLRATRGLAPRRMTSRPSGVLIMTDSAFGLEYARPLPPRMQMVGPMLAEVTLANDEAAWLADGAPVVFVNLGTLARPGSGVLAEIASGLNSREFRALWVLRDAPPGLALEKLRVVPWVSSQLAVLMHPNVRVFVSHCGVNSAHESIYAGTPIVGLPIMADQRDMAQRVADAGVGLVLDKRRLTAASLRQAIHTMLGQPSYTRAVAPIQSSFARAGGVRRAADLIEQAASSARAAE